VKLMGLWLILSLSASARARNLQIFSANVDPAKGEFVVTYSGADCNNLIPHLTYQFSGRTKFGPHHYKLDVSTTDLDCGKPKRRFSYSLKTIRFKIPIEDADQEIYIDAGKKSLIYNTKRPLSENVKIVTQKNIQNGYEGKSKSPGVNSENGAGSAGPSGEKPSPSGAGTK
jgi:hypothetical protein